MNCNVTGSIDINDSRSHTSVTETSSESRASPRNTLAYGDAGRPGRGRQRVQPLLAVLLQQLPRSEAPEASLDPRRRCLHGLLSLPHQEAADARLDLRRRFLLERLTGVLLLQERVLRLRLFLLLLVSLLYLFRLLLLLLLTRLLTTTLRRGRFLQLLAHAVAAEVRLDLRRRRVGLHLIGLLA